MEKLKAPRGTQDIFAANAAVFQRIEFAALETFAAAGYSEIRTPIFESTSLFKRAVGESSDIVNKEMYSFEDRSDRPMTLRPEGTASVVRAFIEHSLDRGPKPSKLWYRGPMFRYERPQTGRYRQFHQIGIECLGSKSIATDLEVIQLAAQLLSKLELPNLTLHINSLGNAGSRLLYRDALKVFLESHRDAVCEDCQQRYESNPLRALDCKVPADQEIYADAPSITDYLDEESQKIWDNIRKQVKELDCKVIEDPRLVRGLDYYNHVVFEFKTEDPALGQQSTVLAGGRYDGLVKSLGGPETAACGWALGIERLATLIQKQNTEQEYRDAIYIICDDVIEAQKLASQLRCELNSNTCMPVAVEYDFESAKIGKQIEKASKKKSRFALFYLEDERTSGKVKIKNLETGEEQETELAKIKDLI